MRKYCLLLLTLFSAATFASNLISVKKAELSRVATEIQQLQKTITLDQRQQENLESELQTTETTIGNLTRQINALNQTTLLEQQRLLKLKTTEQTLLGKLGQQQLALLHQLRAAYQLGQPQSLKIMLNHSDPNALQRHLYYYHCLATARLELISTTKATLDKLQLTLRSAAQHQRNVKNLLARKQAQQNRQQQAQQRRQQLLGLLHQRVETRQQQLTSLISNQKNLQDIVTRLNLQAQSATGLPFTQMQGKLRWPVRGALAARFGSALDVGDQHLAGVIIKAPQGAPIRAISSGKVIFANWLRGFGLLIIINHGNNYMSLYGRNHALFAKVGSEVNTGDVIASAGNSGGFDTASLYFEIRKNGIPVNPSYWCR